MDRQTNGILNLERIIPDALLETLSPSGHLVIVICLGLSAPVSIIIIIIIRKVSSMRSQKPLENNLGKSIRESRCAVPVSSLRKKQGEQAKHCTMRQARMRKRSAYHN